MAIESKLSQFLNKKHWIIIVLFSIMCVYLVGSIVAVEVVDLSNFTNAQTFNIACEIITMFVGLMIVLSIVPTYKRQTGYIRIFITLIFFLSTTCAFDLFQALVDGKGELLVLNKIVTVITFICEANVMFFFWMYANMVLKSKGKLMDILNFIAAGLMLVFAILPVVNVFVPFYFGFDSNASYYRVKTMWDIFARSYHIYIAASTLVAIILSKEKIKTKLIISGFITLPILTLFMREMEKGTAIEYAAMMISVILIYASLFAGNERELYSTNKELGLATNIQKHMLPSIFPAFPERQEFDIYALMDPAKEVGGDFYDFFLIDDTHLGLVMADVSDKGVPAALFMMASKIMVQNFALMGYSPKEVLTRVNKQICMNNQDEMFVTVWFGILDLETGIITASNGGHENPILKSPDGHFEVLEDKHNLVVGFFANTPYSEYQIQLEKGSKLFLYTDGVPEARNAGEQFGMDRTLKTLQKYEDLNPTDLCKGVVSDVMKYIGDYPQFDDITMLCVEYRGYENRVNRVDIPADKDNVSIGITPIVKFLKDLGVEHKLVYKIELALEEVLVNIASYAYDSEPGDIHIEYELLDSPRMIKIQIIDSGKEFNPLAHEDPDISLPIEEREVGGLGLFIVKNTMDEVKYDRRDNKNILTIKKKI